jgi:hypothetical protein
VERRGHGNEGGRGFNRGSRNAERGILLCADGKRAKAVILVKLAKRFERLERLERFERLTNLPSVAPQGKMEIPGFELER